MSNSTVSRRSLLGGLLALPVLGLVARVARTAVFGHDVTLQVVRRNPGPEQRIGDIAHLYDTAAFAELRAGAYHSRTPVLSPRLGFIYVRGAPALGKLRYLADSMQDGIRGAEVRVIHMHLWRVELDRLPMGRGTELIRDGETTITWRELQVAAVNKASGKTLGASL